MPKIGDNSFEKDFETWDYFITDEFVYAVEPTSGKRMLKGGYIKRYLSSNLCFCCTFKYGECYYLAIAEAFIRTVNPRHIAKFNNGLREAWNNFPMFVDSVDFMKPPQTFNWTPIPTMVRLKAFNNDLGLSRNILHFLHSPYSRIVEFNFIIEDGKLRTTTRILSREQCQLPSQMVESRAKIISNLPNGQAPFPRGRLVDLKNKGIIGLLGIALWDDLAWFGFRYPKQIDFLMESLDLFLCPDDFELGAIEGMHELHSNLEQSK